MSLYPSIAEVARLKVDPTIRPRFFHLINPFTPKPGSEHENAQRVTMECIRLARQSFPEGRVEVVAVVAPEDAAIVPGDFVCQPSLTRTIQDVMESPRPLPLLYDILEAELPRGAAEKDDYLIYTNIDIAPTPSFYRFVHEVAQRGIDAFAINRRTVDQGIGLGGDFGMMHSEMGDIHPGTDCLVFRRELLGKMMRSDCCLGIIAVMKSLLYNLAALSGNLIIFKEAHATFHLGDDRQWNNPALEPLAEHNKREAIRLAQGLAARGELERKRLEQFAIERNERFLMKALGMLEGENKWVRKAGALAAGLGGKPATAGKGSASQGRPPSPLRRVAKGVLRRVLNLRYRGPFRLIFGDYQMQSEGTNLSKQANRDFLRNGVQDVRLLDYLIEPVPLIVEADLSLGRSAPLFAFGAETHHPFVLAAREALKAPESEWRSRIREVLAAYYETVTPRNFTELAGVEVDAATAGLSTCAHVLPWERSSPTEKSIRMETFVLKENSTKGLSEGKEGGWAWVGPVSESKLEVETSRLHDLLVSIKTKGYQRHDGRDGDIRAVILMKGPQEWVWMATGGQHRACVLSALGETQGPIRVRAVVRRDDVSAWPNVVNGVYTTEAALTVFDRVFAADYSFVDEAWKQRVQEHAWG